MIGELCDLMVQNAWYIWHPKYKLVISQNSDYFITFYLDNGKEGQICFSNPLGEIGCTETRYSID